MLYAHPLNKQPKPTLQKAEKPKPKKSYTTLRLAELLGELERQWAARDGAATAKERRNMIRGFCLDPSGRRVTCIDIEGTKAREIELINWFNDRLVCIQ